jgi:murein DD-endopeptidase MepM/ murein hydrolase activator NlpD
MPDSLAGGCKTRLWATALLLALSACNPKTNPVDVPPPATAPQVKSKPEPVAAPKPPAPPVEVPAASVPSSPPVDPTAAAVPGGEDPPALLIPVQGITVSQLRDTFDEGRDGKQRSHEALDILAPHGTPVLAVSDGPIVKLFLSKPGGITIYQFDPTRQFAYYYAHLDRYADGLVEGQTVRRGSVVGYVGSTGNADPNAPHLHFAIFRLGPEKQWWKGEAINPFSYLGGRKP